jgi:hypothetical protein
MAKPRDYKAEYARRRASGSARGLTPSEARGHKNEPVERRARRARIRAEYGISPERLSRLRRAARAHIRGALSAAGTQGPINEDTVDLGIRQMSAAILAEIPGMSADALKNLAHKSYEDLIIVYPELKDGPDRNPFWYHPGGN